MDAPELTCCDFASALLTLASWGERDVFDFPWLTTPEAAAVNTAERLLQQLSAIDNTGRITELGNQMAAMPIHPRLARFMIEARRFGIMNDAAIAVAVLSERDPLKGIPMNENAIHQCDLSEKVEKLKSLFADPDYLITNHQQSVMPNESLSRSRPRPQPCHDARPRDSNTDPDYPLQRHF